MATTKVNKRRREIGLRIRRERMLWNMTQEELAMDLGISTNYLGQIERGSRDLSRKMEDRLCDLFSLNHEDFHHLYSMLDPAASLPLSGNVQESAAVFHDLSEEDLSRLLHSCTSDELQLCGHLIRSILRYTRFKGSSPLSIPMLPNSGMAAEPSPALQ